MANVMVIAMTAMPIVVMVMVILVIRESVIMLVLIAIDHCGAYLFVCFILSRNLHTAREGVSQMETV